MKKLLVVFTLLLAFAGSVWAAAPTIEQEAVKYEKDDTNVVLSAIEPNTAFHLIYKIRTDTNISATTAFKSNLRGISTSTRDLTTSQLRLTIPFELRASESGEFILRVTDQNGYRSDYKTLLASKGGDPRIKLDPSVLDLDMDNKKSATLATLDQTGSITGYFLLLLTNGLRSEYSVDDPLVASIEVDKDGYVFVSALKPGTTKIRLKLYTEEKGSPSGDIAECTVTVKEKEAPKPEKEPEKSSSGGGCNSISLSAIAGLILPFLLFTKKQN